MNWARERDHLFLALRKAPIPEKVQAYKHLEKRILKEARTAFEKLEMRRRISKDLLMATSAGTWRGFAPYLRRMERLGYSSIFCRLVACVLSGQASKGSPAGVRKTAALIADIERRTRGRKLHPAVREEINGALARARRFAGLSTVKDTAERGGRRKKTEARNRRSSE